MMSPASSLNELLAVSALWAALVAWLLLRAIRQMRFYTMLEPDERGDGRAEPPLCNIAVVVPVRDEARTIARCMHGLRAQDYPIERLNILIVDDSSADATADIAGRVAAGAVNTRILPAEALPSGWAGKPHACWRGALASDAEWLCFIDADTCPEPPLLRRALAAAQERGLHMLSLEPLQELGSFWERLIIPAGLFAIACSLDIRSTADPNASSASVNGQFLLIRRDAYFDVGGHRAVRTEIAEDSALALRMKQAGYRLGLFGADQMIRVRMYDGLRPLWEGLTKNVTELFGGSIPTLSIAATGFLLGWATPVLPAWAALCAVQIASRSSLIALFLTTGGSLTIIATQIAGARHFRIPWWYGLLFPLSFTATAALAINAVLSRTRGRISWKGRVYPTPRRAQRLIRRYRA